MKDTTTRMSDGQGTTKSPAWDVSQAWEQYQAARAAGDAEAEILAMRRWSEAQTNASIGLVAQVVRPLSEQLAYLANRIENSDRARLERNALFQTELTARLDGHALTLDTDVKALAALVEGAVSTSGKAFRLAEQAQAGVVELAGLVNNQGELIDALHERVEVVETTPGTYPDLLQGMARLEQAVAEISRQSDRRQLYLLVAIGSIVLLVLVLYAIQIVRI